MVAPEIVEPQNVLIDLFMSPTISSRTHRGLDNREVFIEPIRGEDLVVTGIGHRSASELGIRSAIDDLGLRAFAFGSS